MCLLDSLSYSTTPYSTVELEPYPVGFLLRWDGKYQSLLFLDIDLRKLETQDKTISSYDRLVDKIPTEETLKNPRLVQIENILMVSGSSVSRGQLRTTPSPLVPLVSS